MKPDVLETKMKFVLDSVEYHPSGHDNTLQFDPYYRIHLKEVNMWTRSHFHYKNGDSMVIAVKTLTDPNPEWYKYLH
jgi:hypothetical protein